MILLLPDKSQPKLDSFESFFIEVPAGRVHRVPRQSTQTSITVFLCTPMPFHLDEYSKHTHGCVSFHVSLDLKALLKHVQEHNHWNNSIWQGQVVDHSKKRSNSSFSSTHWRWADPLEHIPHSYAVCLSAKPLHKTHHCWLGVGLQAPFFLRTFQWYFVIITGCCWKIHSCSSVSVRDTVNTWTFYSSAS